MQPSRARRARSISWSSGPSGASLFGVGLLLLGPAIAAARPLPTVALLAPRAELLLAQQGRQLGVWRRTDGSRLARLTSRSPVRGALAGDAVVGVFEGVLEVRRGAGLRRRVALRLPREILTVVRATISADGRVAAALYAQDGGAGDPTAATFWNARTGQRLGAVRLAAGRLQGVALSDDGRYAALFGDLRRQAALVEVYALSLQRGARPLRPPRRLWRWTEVADETTFSAAFSPDGSQLVVGAGRRIVSWQTARGRLLAARPTAALLALFPPALRQLRFPGAHQLLFSADGREVLSLHALGVSGVGRWSAGLEPRAWLPRPASAPLVRQLAAARGGELWLVATGGGRGVELYRSAGRRFARTRVLELAR